jgi:hypothetical protein
MGSRWPPHLQITQLFHEVEKWRDVSNATDQKISPNVLLTARKAFAIHRAVLCLPNGLRERASGGKQIAEKWPGSKKSGSWTARG